MDTYKKNEKLTKYTITLVQCKARQLVGKAGYTRDDTKDIEQDLIRDLLERLPKFDSSKATMNTFADRVVCRRICNLLRHRQAEMRDYRRESFSMDEQIETEEGPMERHETIGQDEVDLRTGRYNRPAADRAHLQMDMNAVLIGLSPELRQIADMLRTQSVAEVARNLGIPRSTFREKHLAQLREAFAAHRIQDYLN